MFHSIISDYDVFFAENYGGFKEKRSDFDSTAAMLGQGVYVPNSVANSFAHEFFSTNPNDYLKRL